MKKFRLFLFVFILSLTACQEQMEEATSEFITAKDRLWMIKEIQGGVNSKAVADITKTWQSGDTIRIKFLNGTETLQNKVKQYASIWLEYADLVFEYVENDADVKISFDWEGKLVSWSTIGTDCRLVPQNESSLNFVYLDDPDEEFVRGEVLRAFGHVLGLGFEHKNPSSPLVFKANAAATLQDYYGLTEEEVIDFMAQYQTDQMNYTNYDKSSIMVAEIPGSILENRRLATTFNTELSENDIAFISQLYKPVEPKRTFEFEVLVDSIYLAMNDFFVDYTGKNLYYLQPKSLPIDYENGGPSIIKMNLDNRIKTKIFDLDGIIYGLVVDKQENFYVNLFNLTLGNSIWKFNSNGDMIQKIGAPAGYYFEPRGNPIAIDCNDYLYSFTTTQDFPMVYPEDVLLDSTLLPERVVVDTTYIFRFNSGNSACFKKVEHRRNRYGGNPMVYLMKGRILLRYLDDDEIEFLQMDIPYGHTLLKRTLDINSDHFAFITNRNSDLVYLLAINTENQIVVKSSLYKYEVNNGETHFIGDLPLEIIKADGSVLTNLTYHGGEVLNDNELIMGATAGHGDRNFIFKVNIITEK